MDLTQEQFAENLSAMPEEEQMAAVSVIENSEPIELKNFAKALGVNLILGEEAPVEEEAPLPEEEIPVEEGEVPLPEEEVLPSPVEEIEGVPAAEPEPPSVLPPPAAPEPVPEMPIDQEMQALKTGGDVENIQQEGVDSADDLKPEAQIPEISGTVATGSGSAVGDDKQATAQPGAYVINKFAVDEAGQGDIIAMLQKAAEGLNKRGEQIEIGDIFDPNAQIKGNEEVWISEGEVYISPKVAKYIGYDRLKKINERGKAAVAAKQQEEEQQPAQQGFKEQEIPVRA